MDIENNDAVMKIEAEAELKLLRAVIGNSPKRDEIIDAFSKGNLTEGLNGIYVAVFQCLNDSEKITSKKLSQMIDPEMAEYLCSGSPSIEETDTALKVLRSRQINKNNINQRINDQKDKIRLISDKLDQGEITAEIWSKAVSEIMQLQYGEEKNSKNSETVMLLEEISRLAEENKSHLQEIDTFEEKEKKFKTEIKNKNMELSDLKREIRIKDSAINVQNSKIDELNKILKEERKRLKDEKKKNADNQEKIAEVDSLTEELETTIKKVDELTASLKLSDNAVQEQSEKIKKLNEELKKKDEDEKIKIQQSKKTFEQQINNLNEIIKNLKDEIKERIEKDENKNTAIEELIKDNTNLKEKVQKLEDELKNRDEEDKTKDNDDNSEKIEQLENKIKELEKELELKDEEAKTIQKDEDSQKEIERLNDKIKELEKELELKDEEAKTIKEDDKKTEDDENSQNEIDELKERIKELEQELKIKDEEAKTIKEDDKKTEDDENSQNETDELKERIKELEQELKIKDEEAKTIKEDENSEQEAFEQELNNLNEIIQHLETELKTRDEEDKIKNSENNLLKDKYEQEIKGLNIKIQKLESELDTINELNDISITANNDSKIEKLEDKIKSLEEELKKRDELEAEFDEREIEFAENIRNLIKENQELQEKAKTLESKEEEIKKLHEDLKKAEKKNTHVIHEVVNKQELSQESTFNFEDDELLDIVLQNIREGYPSLNNPMKIGVDQIQINRRLGGLQGITAICGNSQCGKTSLALQFSLESLMNNESGFVLFYTSDHLPEEMYCRMTSQLSGIDLQEIQYGSINFEDEQIVDIINQACTLISSFKNRLKIISAEHFPKSVEELKSQIESMVKFTNGGRGLIVIDSMRGMVAELKDDEQHIINTLRKMINTYSLTTIITKYGKKTDKDEAINSADTVLEFQADRVVKNKDTGENDLIIQAMSRYTEPFQIQMTFSPKTCFFNARNKKFKARVVMSDEVTNIGNKIVKKVPLPQAQYTPKPLMTEEAKPQQQNLYEIL